MIKSHLTMAIFWIALIIIGSPFLLAQVNQGKINTKSKDTLDYVIVRADVRRAAPLLGNINVVFGESMPRQYIGVEVDKDLTDEVIRSLPESLRGTLNVKYSKRVDPGQINLSEEWLIESINKENPAEKPKLISVKSVRVFEGDKQNIVFLNVAGFDSTGREAALDAETAALLDMEKRLVKITLRRGNFPQAILGAAVKTGPAKVYTTAKGKDDADIYFSGKAVGQKGSKPTYSFETKLGLYHSLGRGGAVGGLFTMDADEASNADPDRIFAAASYRRTFLVGEASGIILRSDPVGGEFDRKKKHRNFISSHDAKLVLPSTRLGEGKNFATVDMYAGLEFGNNYKNTLEPKGGGGFFRWKFGAGAYLVALEPRPLEAVNISAEYVVRLPQSAEIFSEKIKGIEDPVFSLTKKPRHNVSINTDFMFTKFFGLTIEYRWGSVPPTFNMVDHKVSGGIKLKLKQTNK